MELLKQNSIIATDSKRNPKLFVRTPAGQKTAKMLAAEKRIGRTLEEDFQEYYVLKGWGYRKLGKRWGVDHNVIGVSRKRSGFRSWVEMLSLPARRELSEKPSQTISSLACEICDVNDVGLDEAHWFANAHGGSKKSYNILKLCPNCHRKLDRDDPITIELCKEKLLFREVKKLIESNSASPKQLRKLIEAILHRKQLE